MSRRKGFLTDVINCVVSRFWTLGIIPPAKGEEITVGWSDLLAPSQAEKIANMDKMADVAVKTTNAFGRSALSENEIRAAGELQPDPTLEVDNDEPPKRADPLAGSESETEESGGSEVTN